MCGSLLRYACTVLSVADIPAKIQGPQFQLPRRTLVGFGVENPGPLHLVSKEGSSLILKRLYETDLSIDKAYDVQ